MSARRVEARFWSALRSRPRQRESEVAREQIVAECNVLAHTMAAATSASLASERMAAATRDQVHEAKILRLQKEKAKREQQLDVMNRNLTQSQVPPTELLRVTVAVAAGLLRVVMPLSRALCAVIRRGCQIALQSAQVTARHVQAMHEAQVSADRAKHSYLLQQLTDEASRPRR